MAINDFETHTNLLAALKNIDDVYVKNIAKFGDFLIVNKKTNEKILVEVKAAGTSGAKKIKVKSSDLIRGFDQVNKNNVSKKKLIYMTYFDESIKTDSDILNNFGTADKAKNVKKITSLAKYNNTYDNTKVMQYTSDPSSDFVKVMKDLTEELNNEASIKKIKNWDKIFPILSKFLKNDWENFIVIDKENLRFIANSKVVYSYENISNFANSIGTSITKKEFRKVIANLQESDLYNYANAKKNPQGFYEELVASGESNGISILLAYMSSKE